MLFALGIDFPLRACDVAARVNFATLDDDGKVQDRRAGRIDTATNEALAEKAHEKVKLDFQGEWHVRTVSEHRAVLVLRGEGPDGKIADTDAYGSSVQPHEPRAGDEVPRRTAELVAEFIGQGREALKDEQPANGLLLRGFDRHESLPSLVQRFGPRAACASPAVRCTSA